MASKLHKCDDSNIEYESDGVHVIYIEEEKCWIVSIGEDDLLIEYCPFCGKHLEE